MSSMTDQKVPVIEDIPLKKLEIYYNKQEDKVEKK